MFRSSRRFLRMLPCESVHFTKRMAGRFRVPPEKTYTISIRRLEVLLARIMARPSEESSKVSISGGM